MTQPAAHDATRPLEFERILSEVRGRLFQQPPAAVRIGRYEVRERLGAGGMGLVYAGVDPELGRRVAIKLVRPELRADADLKASQERLLREAQAMARVSSPNVVTVYDAGAYGDRVYVAMELVEGATLRSWLIREAPGWRQLVDMYIQAGNGLAAVHAAGLVHRDFKPENVLIGGDGRARVADFGLAHAGHAAAATTASARGFASAGVGVTSTGQVAGSAAYMAAERHRGEPADPRSDQFSFCVALWEALYGARPFAGESVSEVRDSILAGVITAPPSSARVPARLRRIVARGLRRAPDERYPEMEALLAALAGARRPRWSRWALALAAPAALALGHASARGEAVAAPVDACAQVEDELAGIWDRDRRRAVAQALIDTGRGYAADVAAQVVDRLDAQADAWVELRGELCEQERSAGDDVAAREQLHLVMACLDRGRGELQALADALLADPDGLLDNAVAAAFRQQSVELCRRRPDLALRSPGTLSPARAASLSRLGARLDVLDALLKAGDHERGQARARGVLADARGLADDHAIAEALYLLGAFTAGRGHHEEAERWLFDAALMAERAGDLVTLARARTELVVVVGYRLGRHDEALRWGEMARTPVMAIDPGGLLDVRLGNALGLVLRVRGDLEGSRAQLEEALAVATRGIGREHPGVASTLDNLGATLGLQGDLEEARARHREALAIRERTLGPAHPDTLASRQQVAALERALEARRDG